MIYEGNPGQGKQAAIEYICKDLLVYIIITKSFNLKYSFSKVIIKLTKDEKKF